MAFDLATYQRELDKITAPVTPDDFPANKRLEEGNYPY